MMPYIIGGAVVLGVFAWLSHSENEARQAFENSQARLKTRLNQMQQQTAHAYQVADESVRFDKYIALYKASVQNSKSFYKDYDNHKKLTRLVSNKRKAIGEQIGELKAMKKTAKGILKQEITNKLNDCYTFLKEVKKELSRLRSKKDEMLEILRQINNNTHHFKMTLKNSCGRGGRMWYERKFVN